MNDEYVTHVYDLKMNKSALRIRVDKKSGHFAKLVCVEYLADIRPSDNVGLIRHHLRRSDFKEFHQRIFDPWCTYLIYSKYARWVYLWNNDYSPRTFPGVLVYKIFNEYDNRVTRMTKLMSE